MFLIVLSIGSAAALAREPAGLPTINLVRADDPPTIDGLLDEPAWDDAMLITDFTQVDPDEGAPPTQRTDV